MIPDRLLPEITTRNDKEAARPSHFSRAASVPKHARDYGHRLFPTGNVNRRQPGNTQVDSLAETTL
jgi:hypothetical protein